MVSEVDKLLRRQKYGTRKGARMWPSKLLLRLLVEIATMAHSTKKKGKKWTVVTNTLVSVYRDEIAKKRAIENFNASQSTSDPTGPMLTARD